VGRNRFSPAAPGAIAAGAIVAGALALVVLVAGAATPEKPAEKDAPPDAETILRTTPTPESYRRHLLHLTEEPHQTGTPRNMQLAEYVRDRFVEYSLEEVTYHDTPASRCADGSS